VSTDGDVINGSLRAIRYCDVRTKEMLFSKSESSLEAYGILNSV